MPTHVDWFEKYAVLQFTGVIVIEDTLALYGQLVGNAQFDEIDFILVDCRSVTKVNYQELDFDAHAAFAKASSLSRRRALRVAIVVASSETENSLKQLVQSFQKYPTNWSRQLFWNYDDALRWASGLSLPTQHNHPSLGSAAPNPSAMNNSPLRQHQR